MSKDKRPRPQARSPMPDIGIDHTFLLKTLRDWLNAGVSASNLASSVRINGFQPYSGGLKAKTVGELSLDLKVSIKEGPDELIDHQAMMNHVNTRNDTLKHQTGSLLQDRVFPEAMSVNRLPQDAADGSPQYLMLMQSLSGYQSLEDALYERDSLTSSELTHVIDVTVEMLNLIHGIHPGDGDLRTIGTTRSPFSKRIKNYLKRYYAADEELAILQTKPGRVNGVDCPPLAKLLKDITWPMARNDQLSLIHGDIHLGNIMLRRRGRNLSVRLIDPNPVIGYSMPLYDYGKLYHFVDPVGWTRRKKRYCSASFTYRANRWSIDYRTRALPKQIEKKRAELVRHLDAKLASVDRADLAIARAAAHVALAVLKAEDRVRGRFCLGQTISHLLAGVR